MATILIVDDTAANRDYLAILLRRSGGHNLLEAADGSEALAIAKTARPDLIVADILMPSMDGYELVRQLRADPTVAQTPVIFWTAHYHEREAQALARSCGVSIVITKPSRPEAVLQAIDAALGVTARAVQVPPLEEFKHEHLRLITDKLSQKSDDLSAVNLRMSALVELSLQLALELDPLRLIQNFCHAARQIVGARYSIAGILDEEGTRFQSLYTSGMSAEAAARLGSPDPKSPALRTVLHEGRPLRLVNPGGDPTGLGFSSSHPPVSSWLGAPIASLTRVYGYIGLIGKMGSGEFSPEDERLAEILAAQVGRIYRFCGLYADAMSRSADLEREIATRVETERALAEREEHVRLLLDSTAEAIYGMDTQGGCTFANRSCARMLGYRDPNQLVGRHMHPLIHHTRKDGTPYPKEECKIFLAFLRNEGSHVDDEVIWRADGSSFPAEYWSYPIRRDGQVVGAVIAFLDITERKRLEDESRQAQQRLREVLVSSPAVLFTLAVSEDRVEKISWISDNLLGVFGYPPEAALDAEWWSAHIHPEDLERIENESQVELFRGGGCAHEFRFRHADGGYRWTRDDVRLIRDETGRPLQAVGAWSDISQQKRAEEEQAKLREQLLQAQKLESVGRLAGGVAHDFNNLLTVINGYSDLLVKELPAESSFRDMAREIGVAGQRAAELTRQLLLLSRKQVIQTSVVNLNDIVGEVGKMLTRVIGEDIQLELILSPTLGWVLADPGQIHQVLMNLAINARDAMPTGGTLSIETRNVDLEEAYVEGHAEVIPGSYVELMVSDTGSGMTKETMSHLYEPFFTTKRVGEGTGLGLATVYGIVKQAGGSIWVYSEPGKGTNFKIYLPLVESAGAAPPTPRPAQASLRGAETILVVEDQAQLLKITADVLRSYGYRVLEAPSPAEAVAQCEGHVGAIDLLLTDVVMPQMMGPELAGHLKALRPAMAVVFMSGYSERAVADPGQLGGSYLSKPFSPQALVEKVRVVLGPPRSTGTIMVVDDEPAVRKLLRNMLAGAGYRVMEAESGKDAVSQVESSEIDLVITDLAMPGQEGFETMEAMRRARPHLKIIAISGRFAGPLLRAAELLGAQASIAKPISSDELLGTVARVMAG